MPHIEWVIAPHYDLRHADRVDEVAQRLRLVHEGVVPDPAQILDRRSRRCRLRLRAHRVTVVRASTVAREISASVRGDDLKARVTIEHPTEDEMRQRDRRLEGLADDVAQVVRADTLPERGAEWMNEHDGTEFFGRRPELAQLTC